MSKLGTAGDMAKVVRIFLSSPGDVAEERKIARELIEGPLQKHPAYNRLKLEVVAWDDPDKCIPMLANLTPQESVDRHLPRPSTCDIVIIILWARMGTPLPETIHKPDGERYLSGTEWEYFDAINSPRKPKPIVLVYRRTEDPVIPARDRKLAEEIWEQLDQVDAFFAQFRNADGSLRQGINEYATPDNFAVLLSQHVSELLHRCFAPAAPLAVQFGALTIPEAYTAWLRRSYERVELLGAKEGRSVTLNSVYVPALVHPGRVSLVKHVKVRPIPLLQRLDAESLYVPAPAGAGKSTFCRWAVLNSIAGAEFVHPVPTPDELREPLAANLRGRLPLLVPLREFWRKMDCGCGEREWRRCDLERALAAWIDAAPPDGLSGELLLAHFKAGSAFLLLDGLDEVAPSSVRDHVTVYPRELLLSGLADALPTWLKSGNRVLLTSRPYGLDKAKRDHLELREASLEPLPIELQDLFIGRWFHALGKTEKTAELIATVRGRNDLTPLAENPMLLTAICVLYDNGGRLPEDRYELYRSIVEGVLHNRYPGEAKEREPVERRLEAIAYGMHVGEDVAPRLAPAAEVSWFEIERLLASFAKLNPAYETGQVEAATRRDDLLNHSGLLVPRPNGRAGFYHLSFQEFLAARRLSRVAEDIEEEFRSHYGIAEWRPTLLFLFAAQIANRDAGWGLSLLGRLIDDWCQEGDRKEVKANPAPAVFIAEALDLCLAKNYAVPTELKENFRRLALNAIEDEVKLQARQALGLTLGRVGDPRIFDARDPRAYVEVPAGTYPYGTMGRTIEITRPIWVGRYPITNQQYATFIAAQGYAERHWWSETGWAWREKKAVTAPWYQHDRRWNAPNQPVVGVSFWEADAFCAWAGCRRKRNGKPRRATRGA